MYSFPHRNGEIPQKLFPQSRVFLRILDSWMTFLTHLPNLICWYVTRRQALFCLWRLLWLLKNKGKHLTLSKWHKSEQSKQLAGTDASKHLKQTACGRQTKVKTLQHKAEIPLNQLTVQNYRHRKVQIWRPCKSPRWSYVLYSNMYLRNNTHNHLPCLNNGISPRLWGWCFDKNNLSCDIIRLSPSSF